MDNAIVYFLNNLTQVSFFIQTLIVFLARDLPYILVLVFVIIALVSARAKQEKIKLLVLGLIAGILGRLAVEFIRFFYHRPRPFVSLPEVSNFLVENSYSFPSGHASFFFGLGTFIFLWNRRLGSVFLFLAFIISLARVASGVHYPSDIVAGAVIGVFFGYLTH